jgi:glycosyltransferase involved in cell wall biosynthesis
MRRILFIIDAHSVSVNSFYNSVVMLEEKNNYQISILVLGRKNEIDESIAFLRKNFPKIKLFSEVTTNKNSKIVVYSYYFFVLNDIFNTKNRFSDYIQEYNDIVIIGEAIWQIYLLDNNLEFINKSKAKLYIWLLELPKKYQRLSFLKNLIFGRTEHRILIKADKIIVPNEARKDFMSRIFNNKDIAVVHNYPKVSNLDEINKESVELAIEDDFFCHTGLVKAYRLPRLVIETFRWLYEKNGIKIVIAGKVFGKMKKIISKYEKEPFIEYLGVVDRNTSLAIQKKAIAGLAIYLPIDINNHLCAPQKVYEYLNNGLPIVCSDNPPLVDLIKKNNLGTNLTEMNKNSIMETFQEIVRREHFYKHNVNIWKQNHLNKRKIFNEIEGALEI